MSSSFTVCTGAGLGLRAPHLSYVLAEQPHVDWFEVHICNFLTSPLNRQLLRQVAQQYALSFHGVSLNLGGTDPLNDEYLRLLADAVTEFQPALVSEHACFTAHQGEHFHDLLPVPYTAAAVEHFVDRIDQVQTALKRSILIENISAYHVYPESQYSEAEFLAEVSRKSGCGILLDINNIYLNQCNFSQRNLNERNLEQSASAAKFDLSHYLQQLDFTRIGEVHLAGHSQNDGVLVDTHAAPVCEEVWQLFQAFLGFAEQQFIEKQCKDQPVGSAFTSTYLPPCLIEWDNDLPSFDTLLQQRDRAADLMATAQAHRAFLPQSSSRNAAEFPQMEREI